MRANVRRDTRPELAVRRAVHRRGLRYKVDARPIRDLPRRADMVFMRAQVAVFIDGCFWHGCPEHGTRPTTNRSYWDEKISGNRRRDVETDAALARRGWPSLRIWEHEDPEIAAARIEALVRRRSQLDAPGRHQASR
jgi:DNA mismatch endonuclease (patch repair protein)